MALSVLDVLDMPLEERMIIRSLSEVPYQTIDQLMRTLELDQETVAAALQRMMRSKSISVVEQHGMICYTVSLTQAKSKQRSSSSSIWDTL